jgi:hypothetical protein
LLNEADFRSAAQALLDELKEALTEDDFNRFLEQLGFSSLDALLEYMVTGVFRNIKDNYTFSTDGKVLFIDEILPASIGSNELSGQTYNGISLNANFERVKDTDKIYTFTASGYTYAGSASPAETGTYSSNSTTKEVWLKRPVNGRDAAWITQSNSNTDDSGYFTSVDDYNAAKVNSDFNESLSRYVYDTAEKIIRDSGVFF